MWEPSRPMPRLPSASPGDPIAAQKEKGCVTPSGTPPPPGNRGYGGVRRPVLGKSLGGAG
eukprot:11087154-Heterocapsa_arctica.AAC.2